MEVNLLSSRIRFNAYIKWRYVSCILQQIHYELHSDHQWWDNENSCAFQRKCIARIKWHNSIKSIWVNCLKLQRTKNGICKIILDFHAFSEHCNFLYAVLLFKFTCNYENSWNVNYHRFSDLHCRTLYIGWAQILCITDVCFCAFSKYLRMD